LDEVKVIGETSAVWQELNARSANNWISAHLENMIEHPNQCTLEQEVFA